MPSLVKNLEHLVTETQHTHDIFTELAAERKDWKVSPVPREPFANETSGAEQVFQRISALGLELELPVGAFIRAALERYDEIPPTAIKGMIENIKDEEKHFQAFQNIARAYQPTESDLQSAITWRKLLLHAQHNPIAKARDLETLVFLPVQGFMRVYGGQTLERVIADVSHDEYRHTNFGWELSTVLRIERDANFEQVCLRIIRWCFEPLDPELQKLWWNVTTEFQETGYSEYLDKTLNYGIHKAPFEISNAYY